MSSYGKERLVIIGGGTVAIIAAGSSSYKTFSVEAGPTAYRIALHKPGSVIPVEELQIRRILLSINMLIINEIPSPFGKLMAGKFGMTSLETMGLQHPQYQNH